MARRCFCQENPLPICCFSVEWVLNIAGYRMAVEYPCIRWRNRIESRALKVIVVLCYRVAKVLPLETDSVSDGMTS